MNNQLPAALSWIAFLGSLLVGVVAFSLQLQPVYVPANPVAEAKVENYLKLARAHVTTDYDINQAVKFYEKAVKYDPHNQEALYELARAKSVIGDFDGSLAVARRYSALFPEDQKILYIAGLAAGFKGDLPLAQSTFEKYVENPNSKWQSRLDLAWVYYQEGEYQKAKDSISGAINKFGDNVWLNTSLGAIEHALGNDVAALSVLKKAKEQLPKVSQDEWVRNYSFNGPEHYKKVIAQVGEVIAVNESLAKGKRPSVDTTSFTKMIGKSPDENNGLVVSACGESCGPQVCSSAANSCGATAQQVINTCTDPIHGTLISGGVCPVVPVPAVPTNLGAECRVVNACGTVAVGTIQCNGSCSAVAPLPVGFRQSCTISNRCGSASGAVGCNGSCNVARYPTCTNPDDSIIGGDDGWTTVIFDGDPSGNGNEYGTLAAKIMAKPSLVKKDGRTVVRWNSYEMSSCTVTGSNGDSWTGVAAEQVSRPLIGRVTYTLSCIGFNGAPLTDSVVVSVSPTVQEI